MEAENAGTVLTVRRMALPDLAFVAAEQLRLFPNGMVGRLGPRFVSAYIRTFSDSPHACALIAEYDGAPVGYLIGLTEPDSHRRHSLRRHGRRLVAAGALGALRHPALGWRLLRKILARLGRKLRPGRRAGSAAVPTPVQSRVGPVAVLSFVAVLERARSLGAGRALIAKFVVAAERAGCARVALVTLAGPDGASAFYERTGWVARGQSQTPEGRSLIAYDLELATPAPHASGDAGYLGRERT